MARRHCRHRRSSKVVTGAPLTEVNPRSSSLIICLDSGLQRIKMDKLQNEKLCQFRARIVVSKWEQRLVLLACL